MNSNPAPQIPDYVLIRRIGKGSYGEVWLAQGVTKIFRALKVVHRSAFDSEHPYDREFGGVTKFLPISQEHTGYSRLFHVGKNDEFFYYVMDIADDVSTGRQIDPERYEPKTLRTEIRQFGRLPVSRCLEIGLVLSEALEHLHGHGLVHRDIKPANIVFIDGSPKLADIGLVTDGAGQRSIVGTEGYFPPWGIGTAGADVYALGKVLYELSSGKDRLQFPELPTGLKDFSDREKFVNLNEVLLSVCNDDPEGERVSAAQLRDALRCVQSGASVPSFGPAPSDSTGIHSGASVPAAKATSRNPTGIRWKALVAVTAVLVLATLGLSLRKPLRLIRTLDIPSMTDWSNAHVADFNGDGSKDIISIQENHILVVSDTGETLGKSRQLHSDSHLSLVGEMDRQGQSRLVVGWSEGPKVFLTLYNQNLLDIQSFSFEVPVRTNATTGKITTPTGVGTLAIDPASHSLYAHLDTGYELKPRGLACFNSETGALKWFHETAPFVSEILLYDLENNGRPGVIVGSSAVCNGNELSNGTDDFSSYAYGLSSEGKELWRINVGGELTTSIPFEAKPPLADAFFLAAIRTPDFTNETGVVSRLDLKGRVSLRAKESDVLATDRTGRVSTSSSKTYEECKYDCGFQLLSWLSTTNRVTGTSEVLLTDRGGRLHVLSSDLIPKAVIQVISNRFDSPELFLDAVLDLDGDGQAELVMHSFQKKNVSGKNPGNLFGEVNVRVFHEKTIWILNNSLEIAGKHLVAAESKSPDLRVFPLPLSGHPGASLLVIADRPLIFKWRSKRIL
jgi:serine/threonine protein kinase